MPTPQPRTINMIRLGHALTDPGMSPPVKALYVYNSNPASVVPNQELVLRGLAREDLFTVVHEQHLTDTTDYADIVLPGSLHEEDEGTSTSGEGRIIKINAAVTPPSPTEKAPVSAVRDQPSSCSIGRSMTGKP